MRSISEVIGSILTSRAHPRLTYKTTHQSKSNPESGSVFTMLLVGIGMAAAISTVLYQTVSGPMSSMVRVTNKTSAKAQMQSVSSIVIMDAINQANGGDCDADGNVEPRAWRAGAYGPTGGGLIPLTIGAPVTDPWGTDYGYCVWDVGTMIKVAGCDGANGPNSHRLSGTSSPTGGSAVTQTVIAIISAGPDRIFQTTCRDYVDATTDVITTGGDDIVRRFTYNEASSATSSLWTLKPSDSTQAVINKNLAIGPTATPTVTVNSASGLISALALTTQGKISSGGAIQLAPNSAVSSCVAGNLGDMRYNTVSKTVETCDGAGNWATATQWIQAGASIYYNAGNVGIGTTNPLVPLDVQGTTGHMRVLSTTGTNAAYYRAQNTAGTAYMGINDSVGSNLITAGGLAYSLALVAPGTTYPIQFATNNTARMTIDSSGNVGIGTATPGNLLSVVKPTAGDSISWTNAAAGNKTGYLYSDNVFAGFYNGPAATNEGILLDAINHKIYFQISALSKMMIDNLGNVGIGTTSPAQKLEVNGIMKWGASAAPYIYSGEDGSGVYLEQIGTNSGTSKMRLQTSTSGNAINYSQFFIDPSNGFSFIGAGGNGNVGIGTTSPTAKLDVGPMAGAQTATSGALGWIRNNAAADTSPYTQPRITVYGGTGVDPSNWAYFGYGADAQMRVVYSKTSSAASLLFGTTSASDGTGVFTPTMTLTSAGNLSTIGTLTTGGLINATNYLQINGKYAIDGTDSWLRLNQQNSFTSGTYTPYNFRSDGGYYGGGTVNLRENTTVSGTLTATGNIFANNQGTYGLRGNDGYFDTVNTGSSGDPLEINYRVAGDMRMYNGDITMQSGRVLYPGTVSGLSDFQKSYYIASHASWGLYTNTSFDAAGGLYDAQNRVYSASNVPNVSVFPNNVPYLQRDTWIGSNYYGSNGDMYLTWKGTWLSTDLANLWSASGTANGNLANYLPVNTWQWNHYMGSDGAEYATIFYDTNNSGYYVDPNGNTNINALQTNNMLAGWPGYPGIEQSAGNYIYPGSYDRTWQQSWYLRSGPDWGLYTNTSLDAAGGLYDASNRVYSASNVPAVSTFSNNVPYLYRDGWIGNNYYGSNGDMYLYWKSTWLSTDLSNLWGTFGNYLPLPWNTWGNNHYMGTDGAEYATVFYDTNNSAYKVDPNGTSRMGDIDADYLWTAGAVDITGQARVGSLNSAGVAAVNVLSTSELKVNGAYSYHFVNTQSLPSMGESPAGLAIGWNYQAGNAEVDFWNMFGNYQPPSSFKFHQLDNWGASEHMLFQINGDGGIAAGTMYAVGASTMCYTPWAFGYLIGYCSSSRRFKTDITPLAKVDDVLALEPVHFMWKKEQGGLPGVGLIAEDVAKVIPDLAERDKEGTINTVNYNGVAVYTLAVVKEQQKKIASLQHEIAELKAAVASIKKSGAASVPPPR